MVTFKTTTSRCLSQSIRSVGLGAVAMGLVMSVGISHAQADDDAAASSYALILQQIADAKLSIAYKEAQIAVQQERIEALQGQIDQVDGTVESIPAMLDKIKVALNSEVEKDIPFNAAERYDRLAGYSEILEDELATPAEKMRRALNALGAEVSYGQSVQAYAGSHPEPTRVGNRYDACVEDYNSSVCALNKDQLERLDSGLVSVSDIRAELEDGNYLRFGRLALAYMTADSSEVLLYNPKDKTWDEMSGGKAVEVRRAMKVARGEAAPSVLQVPVHVSAGAETN